MNSLNRVIVAVAVILGASTIIATSIVMSTYYRVRMSNNNISVAGTATRTVTSDNAVWSASFSRSVSPGDIQRGVALMKKDLDTVVTYLHQNGIADEQITIQPINRYQVCSTNKYGSQDCSGSGLVSYTLEQYVVVQSNDVIKIQTLSQNATSDLSGSGIFFSSQSPQYYFSKLDDLRVELTSEATKSALTRAQKIAESTGASVGILQWANVSAIQISGLNASDDSDYGSYDTSSIDKKVMLVVHASFGLR